MGVHEKDALAEPGRDRCQLPSLLGLLGCAVAAHPERPALIAGDRCVTYRDLWRRIGAAARELSKSGVLKGDRVLLAAPSAPAFVFAYYGIHLLGAVAVLFDPRAPVSRREELIQRTSPKVAFGIEREPHEKLGHIHSISELDLVSSQEIAFTLPLPDDLADLVFTTGTTGHSKGVRLTHGNLAAATNHINTVIAREDHDVEILPLPLNHSFGLGRVRCGLAAGTTLVLIDGFRMPGEIFAALGKHKATGLVGVPAGFAVLLRFGLRGLGAFSRQLRYVEIGSAPMPDEHKRTLMELLPDTQLWMHYGLTEASRSAFIEFHRNRERLDAVGMAAPGVQLSVRRDDGSACAADESGTLWISGLHVSPGYWDAPELTAKTFVDGWVCTGDIASIGPEGFMRLHGRKDDMINVGGFNVSPDEVERVILEHPAIIDAGCIGVPDPRKIAGNVVRAYLVAASDEERLADSDLSTWLAERMEAYKIPSQYVWAASLPRTQSGKLQRAVLRREACGTS
jgi:long-chain acyl-CoA synthetase